MLKLYGIVGKKLGHSFSPNYFNQKFQSKGLVNKYFYRTFELEAIADLQTLLEQNLNLQGFNITIPYKEEIIPFLSHISAEAQEIGAVNTVKVVSTGNKKELCGYNTDVYGFENSLKPLLNPRHKKALVLGTGGASKAVAFVLKKLGIEYLFVSRNAGKANCITYNDISQEMANNCLLVINTTPVGMYPDCEKMPSYPFQFASAEHLFYDLIYNPEKTHFLAEAEKQGAAIKNGLEMLHLQADRAWEIFEITN